MSISKNITITYLSQISNALIGFTSSIFLTRILGPEGRGEYALFYNSVTLLSIFLGFSLPSTIIFFVSTKKFQLDKLLSTLLLLSLSTAVLVWGVLLALHYKGLEHLIFSPPYQRTELELLFVLLFLNTILVNLLNAFLSSYKEFYAISIISIINQIFPLTFYVLYYFKVIVIRNTPPFEVMFYVTVITSCVQILMTSYAFVKKAGVKPTVSKILDWPEFRLLMGYSAIVYLGNGVQFLSYKMDVWFVDSYAGKSELGIYTLAVSLAQLLWLLPNSVASVLYSYVAGGDEEQGIKYTVVFTKVIFWVSLIFGIICYYGFYLMVPIIYGSAFTASIPLIGLLLIGVVPFCITTVVASYNAGHGKFKINLWCSIIGFVFTLVLDLTLIPIYGAMGAAIASCVSYFASTVFLAGHFSWYNGISLRRLLLFTKVDMQELNLVFKKVLNRR